MQDPIHFGRDLLILLRVMSLQDQVFTDLEQAVAYLMLAQWNLSMDEIRAADAALQKFDGSAESIEAAVEHAAAQAALVAQGPVRLLAQAIALSMIDERLTEKEIGLTHALKEKFELTPEEFDQAVEMGNSLVQTLLLFGEAFASKKSATSGG